MEPRTVSVEIRNARVLARIRIQTTHPNVIATPYLRKSWVGEQYVLQHSTCCNTLKQQNHSGKHTELPDTNTNIRWDWESHPIPTRKLLNLPLSRPLKNREHHLLNNCPCHSWMRTKAIKWEKKHLLCTMQHSVSQFLALVKTWVLSRICQLCITIIIIVVNQGMVSGG